jgi:hypothetical protein
MKKLVALSGLAIAAACTALRAGRRRQRRVLRAIEDRLRASRVDPSPPLPADLLRLPAPVARYLQLVIPAGRRIDAVRLRQEGTLRTDVRRGRWLPFEAEQLIVPGACAFVWNARVALAPLAHVGVRDALVSGEGSGEVSLLSAWTVKAECGRAEVTSGSLHRYLAEGPWCPTALYPSDILHWSAIDAHHARATLTAHGTTVSLEFRFAHNGEVESIYTPGRWGAFRDGYKKVAWEGHFHDYERRDGVLIPTRADVSWVVDGVPAPVWQGQVTTFAIEPR